MAKMMTIIKNKTRMPHSLSYELDGTVSHITVHPKGTYEIDENAKIVSNVPEGVRVLPPLKMDFNENGPVVVEPQVVETPTPVVGEAQEPAPVVEEAPGPVVETPEVVETPTPVVEETPAPAEEAEEDAPLAASNTANRRHKNRNRNRN